MEYRGKVRKFGSDVNTDAIIPARYLNTSDPDQLAAHCMEDLDPGFMEKIEPGDIIVAEKNFGCGSSREHAPIAIKAAGISCVIAASFARIFYRNAINIGLPILEAPEASMALAEGQEIRVDLTAGTITNEQTGEIYKAAPFPGFMRELMEAGGLIPYVQKKVAAAR